MEVAVAAELLAFMDSPGFKKEGAGLLEMLKECGKPVDNSKLPPGITSAQSSLGNRAGMVTCTFAAMVSDPALALTNWRRVNHESDVSVERLADGLGYRIRATIESPQDKRLSQNSTGPGADIGNAMVVAMFSNRYITIAMSGDYVASSTGEVNAENKTVTWRIPLVAAINQVSPVKIEADIIYQRSWFERWKAVVLAWMP